RPKAARAPERTGFFTHETRRSSSEPPSGPFYRSSRNTYKSIILIHENTSHSIPQLTSIPSSSLSQLPKARKMSNYTGPGIYMIIPMHSKEMCLDIWCGSTDPGTPVKL
ncbi:hypothetical protein FRB95_005252, partial [Tulasnella sp. JGI-2019a]